jgi:hypothetical protein
MFSPAHLPWFSPPVHLDAREALFPRPFRVRRRERIPLVETWGTRSATWSRDWEAATPMLAISSSPGDSHPPSTTSVLRSPRSPPPSELSAGRLRSGSPPLAFVQYLRPVQDHRPSSSTKVIPFIKFAPDLARFSRSISRLPQIHKVYPDLACFFRSRT